jgi:hypothetical protein
MAAIFGAKSTPTAKHPPAAVVVRHFAVASDRIRPTGKAVLGTGSSLYQGVKKESHNILLLTSKKPRNSADFNI